VISLRQARQHRQG